MPGTAYNPFAGWRRGHKSGATGASKRCGQWGGPVGARKPFCPAPLIATVMTEVISRSARIRLMMSHAYICISVVRRRTSRRRYFRFTRDKNICDAAAVRAHIKTRRRTAAAAAALVRRPGRRVVPFKFALAAKLCFSAAHRVYVPRQIIPAPPPHPELTAVVRNRRRRSLSPPKFPHHLIFCSTKNKPVLGLTKSLHTTFTLLIPPCPGVMSPDNIRIPSCQSAKYLVSLSIDRRLTWSHHI